MFKALPRKGSRSTASSTKSKKTVFAQSRDTLKPPKGGSSLPRTQLPRYVPKQYWADPFKEVLIPRCAQIDERIFCRIKARNRRNTLCISRFRDEIRQEISHQNVYRDGVSGSFFTTPGGCSPSRCTRGSEGRRPRRLRAGRPGRSRRRCGPGSRSQRGCGR